MTNSEKDLFITRVIRAPRAAVWRAWSDPAQFVKWWAPKPVVTTVQKMELKPGGAFNTTMRMEDGTEYPGRGCFLEIINGERIVFTDALQEGWRPNEESFFSAVITMNDHPDGTLYTSTALHKNDEDRRKHADMGFLDGWGTAMDQLEALAKSL